jgi:hypothetical protein
MATVTREGLLKLLNENQAAVERAVLVLQARQTADEQHGVTKHENGRGWSAYDAKFGRDMFDWIMLGTTPSDQTYTGANNVARRGYGKRLGTTLLPNQLKAVRKMVAKYVGQLLEEAQAKAGQPAAQPAPQKVEEQPADMLSLVRMVIHDAEEGMSPEAIASYLTAHGWTVTGPSLPAPESPLAAPETSEELDLDPEPQIAAQPASATAGGVHDDPGF